MTTTPILILCKVCGPIVIQCDDLHIFTAESTIPLETLLVGVAEILKMAHEEQHREAQ